MEGQKYCKDKCGDCEQCGAYLDHLEAVEEDRRVQECDKKCDDE